VKICSFLPSATEILYALNLGDNVSGVTYECDYPEEARLKPVVVNTRLAHSTDPQEINRQVSEFMAKHESLYRIETDLLCKIQPDLIVTQDLCRVCAASPGDLASALAVLPRAPEVLNLNPHTLDDVWNDVFAVAKFTGRGARADTLVAQLRARVEAIGRVVAGVKARPRVLCLEWLDPAFIAGHWVPEMVERAGGMDVLGRVGEAGFRAEWQDILRSKPEVIVIMPCGYHLKEAVAEFQGIHFPSSWMELPAVIAGRVFAVDASSYFSRPGPRLADGVEILAHLCHPGCVAKPALPDAITCLS
jgi:iron complex transport system substrate-binding protein